MGRARLIALLGVLVASLALSACAGANPRTQPPVSPGSDAQAVQLLRSVVLPDGAKVRPSIAELAKITPSTQSCTPQYDETEYADVPSMGPQALAAWIEQDHTPGFSMNAIGSGTSSGTVDGVAFQGIDVWWVGDAASASPSARPDPFSTPGVEPPSVHYVYVQHGSGSELRVDVQVIPSDAQCTRAG